MKIYQFITPFLIILLLIFAFISLLFLIKLRKYKKRLKRDEGKSISTSDVHKISWSDINIWNKKRVNFTLDVIIKEELEDKQKHILGSNDIERAGSKIAKVLNLNRFSSQQYIVFAGEYEISADIGINIDEVYFCTKNNNIDGEIDSIYVLPNIQPSKFETLFPKVFLKGIMKGELSKGAKIFRDITEEEQEKIDKKAIGMANEQALNIAIPIIEESIKSSIKLNYPEVKVIISREKPKDVNLIPYKERIEYEKGLGCAFDTAVRQNMTYDADNIKIESKTQE